MLPADELAVYIDELAELAGYADVRIITANAMTDSLDMRRATLFYDFFYSVVACAAGHGCSCMLVHLGPEQVLRLLPSVETCAYQMEEGLAVSITAAGGVFAVKDLDGAVGLSLTFPEGGGKGD